MSLLNLALKNIRCNAFRSSVIFLCVFSVSSFLLGTTLIISGAQNSLNVGIQRLGADILVVPEGAETKIETALLMGKPTNIWMPVAKMLEIGAVPGVEAVSPQIYLQSLFGAPCCAVSEMFLVVYDSTTDFTVRPWLDKELGRPLVQGEVIGGSYIFVPASEKYITLYGYNTTLAGNLGATGTGIDQTLFMTLETAQAMAKSSLTTAVTPLVIPPGKISEVMVKIAPGADRHKVALDILLKVLGVVPLESPNMFGQFRHQMTGLLWGFVTIMVVFWVLSAGLIGLVFSMAANERRREIAVLRALGATRAYVFLTALMEEVMLALAGAILGVMVSAVVIYLFRGYITSSLGMPFLFPGLPSFLVLLATGTAFILVTVALAALVPAFRISRMEPAIAARE
jgi:putative ABC transport system permease protein